MKKFLLASALVLGSYSGAAQAVTTITSPASLNLVNLGTGNGNGLQVATTATVAATTPTVFTPVAGVFSGTRAATTATDGFTSPFGASSNQNYFAIEPGGSITFTLAAAQTTFGLLFGTIDSYNFLTFTGVGGTQTYSGADVATALGVAANGGVTRNVLFSGLNPFTSVTLSDTTASAFEFVPGTAAVPEPAAWGMMILGFGLVGGVMRRRPTTKVRFA